MSCALKERIKNLIILILIVTGIFQVGILFGYQSQGTPTNLFLGLFGKTSQISDADIKEALFTPKRLVLSDGVEFQIIDKDSGTYSVLWADARRGLENMASGDLSFKASSEQWGDLIEKKGIIIDFGYIVKNDLIRWFLGGEKSGKDLPDIRKIMIKPDIDLKTGLIYMYNGQDRIYVSDTITFNESVNLDKIYEAFTDNDAIHKYVSARSANMEEVFKSPPDLLYVNSGPYWPYYEYNCKIPEKVKNSDEFAEIILGNEIDRYSKSKKNYTSQFIYDKNVYRLYSDGYITYNYLDALKSSERCSSGDALSNAYKFVDKVNRLSNSDADIMLSNIEENDTGGYAIYFDYYLDNMQVRLNKGIITQNGDNPKHSIYIQADNKRVLECKWLVRDFNISKKDNYNDRYMDLASLTGHAFDELEINDINSGYFLKSTAEGILKPSLLIDTKDNSIIPIEMPAEKGD